MSDTAISAIDSAAYFHSLGLNFSRVNDFQNSVRFFRMALEKYTEAQDSSAMTSEYRHIGMDEAAEMKYAEAILSLESSLASDKKSFSGYPEAYLVLSEAYGHTGNFAGALKYKSIYYQVKDSLQAQILDSILMAERAEFEAGIASRDNKAGNMEAFFNATLLRYKTQLQYAIVAASILLLLFLILLVYSFRLSVVKTRTIKQLSSPPKNGTISNPDKVKIPGGLIIHINLLEFFISRINVRGDADLTDSALISIRAVIENIRLLSGDDSVNRNDIGVHKHFDVKSFFGLIRESANPETGIDAEVIIETDLPEGLLAVGDRHDLLQSMYLLISVAVDQAGGKRFAIRLAASEYGNAQCRIAVGISGVDPFNGGLDLTHPALKTAQRLAGESSGELIHADDKELLVSFVYDVVKKSDLARNILAANSIPSEFRYHGTIKILVADDDPYEQLVAVDELRRYFPDLEEGVATNGLEVLAALSINSYNLIFMDLDMPMLDGHETVKRIRQGKTPYSGIPVVGVTEADIRNESAQSSVSGINGFISKPYAGSIMAEAVLRYSGINFTESVLPPVMPGNGGTGDEKYIQLFMSLVPQRLKLIEDAVKRGDWKAIRQTVHLMKPQLIAFGMLDLEQSFDDFEQMDGSIPFSGWNLKSKDFCSRVRMKTEEIRKTVSV